jgi:hypothetical protein
VFVTQDKDGRLTRNSIDGTVNKLIGDRIADHQNPALRKAPDYADQALLQQCSLNCQMVLPSFWARYALLSDEPWFVGADEITHVRPSSAMQHRNESKI